MEQLHQLISQMSMAERSYFKRYAAKMGEGSATNYMQLFDAIAAQETYDEASLKKKFAKEKFVKQFSVAKTYLYQTILRTLKNFYEESNVQVQIKHLQLELTILMEKGMYVQADKVIAKGISLAKKYELFNDCTEFLQADLYLAMNGTEQVTRGKSAKTIEKEYQEVFQQWQNLLQFESLYIEQYQLNKSNYQIRDRQQLKVYSNIFHSPQLLKKSNALSNRALYYYHFIRTIHYSVTDQRQDFLTEAQHLVDVCYRTPYFAEFDLRSTMNALNLLLEASYYNQDWKSMNAALKRLNAVDTKSERDKIAQFIYYSRFGIVFFDQQKKEKEKRKLIAESWKSIQRFSGKIPYHIRLSIMVTYCSALMEMGEYADALNWIELYRQNKKEDEARFDVQSILLMMQLIAHYELGNHLLVKNLVPNIARFIRKSGQQSKFEKIVLSFIGKLTSSEIVSNQLFEKTLKEINALKEGDIVNRNRVIHDIFKVFIESKQHRKKYHEMLRMP